MGNMDKKKVLLSTFSGDVGHKSFYEKATNTKINEEKILTNKLESFSYLELKSEYSIDKDSIYNGLCKGNVDFRVSCDNNVYKSEKTGGNEDRVLEVNQNFVDQTLVKGDNTNISVCKGNCKTELYCDNNVFKYEKTKGNEKKEILIDKNLDKETNIEGKYK